MAGSDRRLDSLPTPPLGPRSVTSTFAQINASLTPEAFAPSSRIRVAPFVLLDLPVYVQRGEPHGAGVPDFIRGRELHS